MKLSLKKIFESLEEEATNLEPYFTSGVEEGSQPTEDPSVMAHGSEETDQDPPHAEEYEKVAHPQGWGKGNKPRSWQGVGRHAGRMNRGDAYPELQQDLGWGDGNERSDEQMK